MLVATFSFDLKPARSKQRLGPPSSPRVPRLARLLALARTRGSDRQRHDLRLRLPCPPGPRQPRPHKPDNEPGQVGARHPGRDSLLALDAKRSRSHRPAPPATDYPDPILGQATPPVASPQAEISFCQRANPAATRSRCATFNRSLGCHAGPNNAAFGINSSDSWCGTRQRSGSDSPLTSKEKAQEFRIAKRPPRIGLENSPRKLTAANPEISRVFSQKTRAVNFRGENFESCPGTSSTWCETPADRDRPASRAEGPRRQ